MRRRMRGSVGRVTGGLMRDESVVVWCGPASSYIFIVAFWFLGLNLARPFGFSVIFGVFRLIRRNVLDGEERRINMYENKSKVHGYMPHTATTN